MFWKWKTTHVIRGQRRVKVIDWDAVGGAVVVTAIGVGVLVWVAS